MMNSDDGQEGYWLCYHITFKSRVDSILKSGLLPAAELKGRGYEQPYPSDDRFVHLFNPVRMKKNIDRLLSQPDQTWLADKEILEVRLPESHPVEREYDQAIISLRLAGEELEWFLEGQKRSSGGINGSAEDYVRHYFKKTHGIDYTGGFTMKDVCDFIDAEISDDQWARNDGAYRTKVPIPSECLRIASTNSIFGSH